MLEIFMLNVCIVISTTFINNLMSLGCRLFIEGIELVRNTVFGVAQRLTYTKTHAAFLF